LLRRQLSETLLLYTTLFRSAKENELGGVVHQYEPIAVQPANATLGVGAPTDEVFLLEDVTRPGEFMEATEDEHGTYIMNSKDLRDRKSTRLNSSHVKISYAV